MAIIIEDGTAKVDAEAYVSEADATTYLTKRGKGDAWDLVDDKEAALRNATDYMTQVYRARWTGYRRTSTQRLDWPRENVELPDAPGGAYGYPPYLDNDVVPEEVRNACAELALLSASTTLNPTLTRAKSSVVIGPIQTVYDPASSESPRFPAVDAMLAPYLSGGGVTRRLVRA